MSQGCHLTVLLFALSACSGSSDVDESARGSAGSSGATSPTNESLPLEGGSGGASAEAAGGGAEASPEVDSEEASAGDFVRFVDPETGFETDAVHDVDRQVVHFDAANDAMVWAASGDAVTGWTTSGADLSWDRSGVRFRVRFGTEDGARRAYFTEAGPGTICDLDITAPDNLSIRATSERPPEESE